MTDEHQDALVQAERDALEAVRDRVMNVVGHGLRTPMATVRGQVEVLAKTTDEARRDELITALLRSSRKLEQLLDDVLVAAGIETRMPVGAASAVDVPATVREVWAELMPERELDLRVDGGTDALVQPGALRWMLRHLIDNALRYGRGAVEVGVHGNARELTVSVGGDGEALPDDELDNAFELFYRGHAAVMSDGARLGVGLPVTRSLAAANGGAVVLRRRDGGGTVARLTLARP